MTRDRHIGHLAIRKESQSVALKEKLTSMFESIIKRMDNCYRVKKEYH